MSLGATKAVLMRGDPGLFDILKKVGRIAVSTLTGGPVAGISTAVGSLGFRSGPTLNLPPIGSIVAPGGARIPVPGITGAVQRALPGGATGFVDAGAGMAGCPKGFHLNRSAYMTRAGPIAKMSRCVRNRRRNLSNGRANSKALRRMAAWEKQDKRRRVTLRKIARSAS